MVEKVGSERFTYIFVPNTDFVKIMELTAHFIKDKDFRTIFVSGVLGGVFTAEGTLNMTFFTERPALPKSVVYQIEDGTNRILQQTISDDSKIGVVREICFSTNMDIDTAERIQQWLKEQIDTYRLSKK